MKQALRPGRRLQPVFAAMVAIVDGLKLSEVSPVRRTAHESTAISLIHGLADHQTPPYNSQRLQQANPRNELWLVPGARHVGASRVASDEFRRRVLT